MTTDLAKLSAGATQGGWWAEGPDYFGDYNLLKVGETSAIGAVVSNLRDPSEIAANAAFIAALVNAYRTGQLVERDGVVGALEAADKALCLEGYTVVHPVIKQIAAALTAIKGGDDAA